MASWHMGDASCWEHNPGARLCSGHSSSSSALWYSMQELGILCPSNPDTQGSQFTWMTVIHCLQRKSFQQWPGQCMNRGLCEPPPGSALHMQAVSVPKHVDQFLPAVAMISPLLRENVSCSFLWVTQFFLDWVTQTNDFFSQMMS